MKILLLLTLSLTTVAAGCNRKSYLGNNTDENHRGIYTNLQRKIFNKENYLAHCSKFPLDHDRQIYLNGSDRKVYGRRKRDISKVPFGKWENAVIPFVVEKNAYSQCALSSLSMAMTYWEETTCVRFVNYVDSRKTPRPLLVSNFLNNRGNTFASCGHTSSTYFDGQDARMGLLATTEGYMRSTRTMLHELGHVLMLNHPEDSPRARTPYRSGANKVGLTEFPWYPLSVSTNIDEPRAYFPTDWDIWTINAYYNCTKTTRGNKPIDVSQQELINT